MHFDYYTFLRDNSNRVLIGVDHAPLGFGHIAAHGHADALSFQMMVDGQMVFTDPGTYIYHSDLPARNAFRKTVNHNTVELGGRDQSEMLGAFMWGRKAKGKCESWTQENDLETLVISHDGYKPVIHTRKFEWDKAKLELCIADTFSAPSKFVASFVLGAGCTVKNEGEDYVFAIDGRDVCKLFLESECSAKIEPLEISLRYGQKTMSNVVRLYGFFDKIVVKMKVL
jgi:hypothetical protein